MSLVQAAEALARKAHDGQTYDGVPFADGHLAKVVEVAREIADACQFTVHETETLLAAAWLHDVLEDTMTLWSDVASACGDEVMRLVLAVTDEPGKDRKERKARTYPKIRAAGRLAVALKLADRIANVRASCAPGASHSFLKMYRTEHIEFTKALYQTSDNLDYAWILLMRLLATELS